MHRTKQIQKLEPAKEQTDNSMLMWKMRQITRENQIKESFKKYTK